MFCNQCQETVNNTACTVKGVCGKDEATAQLQDLLIYTCQGLSYIALQARIQEMDTNVIDKHIVNCLFMTITNANFDEANILEQIYKTVELRDEIKGKLHIEDTHSSITWQPSSITVVKAKAVEATILAYSQNEDLRALKQYILYGLKGVAAYCEHAFHLNYEDQSVYNFIEEALVSITKSLTGDELLSILMRTGENGVKVMALLDKANNESFGTPEMSQVNLGVSNNPGILISGHDLKDLEQLLIQTKGTGIDVYTHSEMLPSHAYPELKKYDHLIGNYGGAWHTQLKDFETFNGPILFTTNCLVPPRKTTTYNDRVFTTGATGMPGWKKIDSFLENGHKDFSQIIALAHKCGAPSEIETGKLTIGFAHNQVLALADKILDAVNSGAIKRMVVMSGCDARNKSRSYYTEFAENLPKDTVILTSGCAKYRYNKLNLGDINGIPRLLDAGQCNDSYSWAIVALKLKEVLGLDDINDLPLTFNIAWYEQKAIIVHLALLYLGVQDIHIGPTLPGFITPNILKVVQEKFGTRGIQTVEEDLKLFKLDY